MSRYNTLVLSNIRMLCRMQNIDEKVLYERAKLILSIYRCHIVLPFLDHRSRESSHSSNDRLEMRMALPIRTILKCPSFTRIYAEVLPMPRI